METETKETIEKKETIEVPKSTRKLPLEFSLYAALSVLMAAISALIYSFGPIQPNQADMFDLTYSAGKTISFIPSFIGVSAILGTLVTALSFVLLYFVRPSGIKPEIGEKGKWLIAMILLGLFGILAYIVIDIFLAGLGISNLLCVIFSGIIVPIYDIFIYKLYMERRTYSNDLFWEIFRFAIVGLVAAVFDFATCFIFQFVVFKGNDAAYVTAIATALGFVVGVTINYLMSTYMVYKAASSTFSKTFKGMVTFLVLSAIGLFIGIGIQILLYDVLYSNVGVSFLTYPVDFVIRTLIVMVYNYLTRKIFIYK